MHAFKKKKRKRRGVLGGQNSRGVGVMMKVGRSGLCKSTEGGQKKSMRAKLLAYELSSSMDPERKNRQSVETVPGFLAI